MKTRITAAIFVMMLMFSPPPSAAQVPPKLINYQGRLVQGTNLASGALGLSLRLYDAPVTGSLLYEDSNNVAVVDGIYSTFIGDQTTAGSLAAALASTSLYLAVSINGGAELSPRERIVSVAYALLAESVKTGAVTAAMLADGAALEEILDDDGAGSGLDADTLDGIQGSMMATLGHSHAAADIVSGTLEESLLSSNVSLLGQSIQSSEIEDGTVAFADMGQNGAENGQVVKWNGTAWTNATDQAGGGGGAGLGQVLSISPVASNLDLLAVGAIESRLPNAGRPNILINRYGADLSPFWHTNVALYAIDDSGGADGAMIMNGLASDSPAYVAEYTAQRAGGDPSSISDLPPGYMPGVKMAMESRVGDGWHQSAYIQMNTWTGRSGTFDCGGRAEIGVALRGFNDSFLNRKAFVVEAANSVESAYAALGGDPVVHGVYGSLFTIHNHLNYGGLFLNNLDGRYASIFFGTNNNAFSGWQLSDYGNFFTFYNYRADHYALKLWNDSSTWDFQNHALSNVATLHMSDARISNALYVANVLQPRFLGQFTNVNPRTVACSNPGDWFLDVGSNTTVRSLNGTTNGYVYQAYSAF